jgi:predicted nuclease with TOPRIM domain
MKSKEAVPLKKVLKSVLGNIKSMKYLHGLDFAYIDSTDIYQGALANLLNGNTEKTLKCIIFGLDLDRENNSIIHLARTMLFSLSEDFYESGGDLYRQKYSDLNKASEQLNNKIKDFKKEIEDVTEEMEELEVAIQLAKTHFFLFFFKKAKLNKQFQENKIKLSNLKSEIGRMEEEFVNLNLLAKIEEYMRVLGVVIEVCIFPIRFGWALTN